MRVLAIETSGRDATLAVFEGQEDGGARLIAEAAVTGPEKSAQLLAPRLGELLEKCGWTAKSIGLVCVAVGPGSFTGLRIGVTMAKTLAYAVEAEVIGVNTLAVIANQVPALTAPLWVVTDAQRQELFVAKFDATRKMVGVTLVLSQKEWIELLEPGDHVMGPGLQRLRVALPTEVNVVDEVHWPSTAATVGKLGWREYQAGRRDDLWKLLPQYFRQSAAEEKKMGR